MTDPTSGGPAKRPGDIPYLRQQEAEGHKDSEGVFTLALGAALRKLGAFQLPTPESWILVLVQAAHRGGASQFVVQRDYLQSNIIVSGSRRWEWAHLRAVLAGEPTGDGALIALAVVLRALASSHGDGRFYLTPFDGSRVEWKGGAFVALPGVGRRLSPGQWALEVRHRSSGEAGALNWALTQRCLACSLPIVYDGQRIPNVALPERLGDRGYQFPVATLPVSNERIAPTNLIAADWRAPARQGVNISARHQEPLAHHPLAACVVLLVSLVRASPDDRKTKLGLNHSRLLWVLDGVVVQESELPIRESLSLTVIASAAGLRTDLSGLALVQDHRLTERLRLLKESVGESLRKFHEQSLGQGLQVSDKRTTVITAALTAASLGALIVYPITFMATIPYIMLFTYLGKSSKAQSKQWELELNDQLATLAERVDQAFDSLIGPEERSTPSRPDGR